MIENIRDMLISNSKNERIIGRGKYRNSVVLLLLVRIEKELFFLLEKRAKNISQEGEICFPGGKPNVSDSSITETALRETEEELGINRNLIKIIGSFGTLVSGTGAAIDVEIGFIENFSLEILKLNADEVEKVLLVPFTYFNENPPQIFFLKSKFNSIEIDENDNENIIFPAKKLGIPKKYYHNWSGHPIEIYVYQFQGETIWGITAEIIYDLIVNLKDKNR